MPFHEAFSSNSTFAYTRCDLALVRTLSYKNIEEFRRDGGWIAFSLLTQKRIGVIQDTSSDRLQFLNLATNKEYAIPDFRPNAPSSTVFWIKNDLNQAFISDTLIFESGERVQLEVFHRFETDNRGRKGWVGSWVSTRLLEPLELTRKPWIGDKRPPLYESKESFIKAGGVFPISSTTQTQIAAIKIDQEWRILDPNSFSPLDMVNLPPDFYSSEPVKNHPLYSIYSQAKIDKRKNFLPLIDEWYSFTPGGLKKTIFRVKVFFNSGHLQSSKHQDPPSSIETLDFVRILSSQKN